MSESGIHIHISLGPEVEAFLPKLKEILGGVASQGGPETGTPNIDEIMTPDDLAELWRVPKSKIYGLTMQTGPGSIPRFKIGRDLRFKRSEVMAWAENNPE